MVFLASSTHRKIQEGSVKEFEKLFRKFYEPLCLFANSFLRDMDAAEEIVQDLFYNYWKKRETISIGISIKSYLYQAVKNNSLKYIEHQQVKHRYSQEVKSVVEETTYCVNEEMEATELNHIIESTLNQLPERCREIFVMNRFEGLKYHEIAHRLSISIKTVEANMGKALKLFRSNLRQYDQLAY